MTYYVHGVTSVHELLERIAADRLAVSGISYMVTQQEIGRSANPRDAQNRLDELLE